MTEQFFCERRGVKFILTVQTTSGDAHSILTDVGRECVRRLIDSKLEGMAVKFLADLGAVHEPKGPDAPHL